MISERTLREREAVLTRPGEFSVIQQYKGEVVYMYAFDVAYELQPLGPKLLGQPLSQFSVDSGKRMPKQFDFYRPQMVRLPRRERAGPHGSVLMEPIVKLLPVGAMSITIRVPFSVSRIEQLVAYHDLQFSNGSLTDEVRTLAEEIRQELIPYSIRPVPRLAEEEAYTVFCVESPLSETDGEPWRASEWFKRYRRHVAALLTQELDISRLSEQEVVESTTRHLSYYHNDLIVIDWDAALLIEEREDFEQVLYVIELANLQLAELEAYDRILDEAFGRSYQDLRTKRYRRRANVLDDLRDIRIDMTRFSDELSNLSKFFGDWHLARVYENIAARFHLGDWHRSVDSKLSTLDNLYEMLKHDQTNRWMLLLELTIVLLFIIDLLALFWGAFE